MSLNSLPDEIIAKIAKKMPHCDRLNLMATSQKQAIIGQKYRLQYKYLRVKELAIYGETASTDDYVSVDIYPLPSSDSDSCKLNTTIYKLPSILKEMRSIENLDINYLLITPDLIKEIIKHKNKLDTFTMESCLFQTKTDFNSLTDCFKKLTMSFSSFGFPIPHEQITETDDIFTEEFLLSEETLGKVLPRSSSFLFFSYKNDMSLSNGTNLTDRFLHEILLKSWPMEFFTFEYCRTSFTLQGVLHFIKLAEAICSVQDHCILGCFFVENKQDAVLKMTEFTKEFNYELVIDEYEHPIYSKFDEVKIGVAPRGKYGFRPFYKFRMYK